MHISYAQVREEKDWQYLTAQIMWYTILPMGFTYATIKMSPFFIILVIPCMILRLKR